MRAIQPRISGSGVTLVGRRLFNSADYNPDMNGQLGTAKYERMRRDPQIAGALSMWKKVLESANGTFEEPDKDLGVPQATVDIMMELCNRYILGETSDGASRWKSETLPHIMMAFDFGCSALEKIWAVNEKGQQVYYRLAPIMPQTISEFELGDHGEIVRVVQYAYTNSGYKKQEIPDPVLGGTFEEKAAVFTYRKEGDNYFGRPPLRELYEPWFHKHELWTLDGIQKERHGMGLTVLKIPDSVTDTTSAAYLAAVQVVTELRGHERQGAVIGDTWDLQLLWPSGTAPDILGSQKYCDEQITQAMGTDVSQLGQDSGSRALGEAKINHFMLCRQSDANQIEAFVNSQLVPILCKMNVGPQAGYPRYQFEDIDKMAGTQQAEVIAKLGPFIRYDRKLEDHLRENNDLPPVDEATREEPPDPMELALAGKQNPGEPIKGKEEDGEKKPKAKKEPEDEKEAMDHASTSTTFTTPEHITFTVTGGGAPSPATLEGKEPPTQNRSEPPNPLHKYDPIGALTRAPFAHEGHVDFERMASFLGSEPRRIWKRVVVPFRDAQIRKLAGVASKATDKELADGLVGIALWKGRMGSALGASLLDAYMSGRKSVVGDRLAQVGESLGKAEDDSDEFDIAPTASQRGWIQTIAAGVVTSLIAGLVLRAKDAAMTARQTDAPVSLQRSLVEQALRDLSTESAIATLAGRVTQAFSTGREEQAKSMSKEIETAYYSAIMDENTCEDCASRDGEEHELGDPNYATPSPFCAWPANCRCVDVYVFKRDAA